MVVNGCKDLLKVLEPIAKALNSLQRNDISIADAVEIWKDLMETPVIADPDKSNVIRIQVRADLELKKAEKSLIFALISG